MGRRRREDGDSLGLLLDPICNTFGGIIFLAMIISLLSHRELHTGRAGAAVAARLQAINARRTRDRLAAELADASARTALARDTLMAIWGVDDPAKIRAQQSAPPLAARQAGRAMDVLTRLAAERSAFDQRAAALAADRQATQQALDAALDKNRQAAARLAATRARAAADRAVAAGGADHAVRLRTPLAHLTTKQQVPLLLAHGRVYVPFQYDHDGHPTDPSPDCGPKMHDREASIGPDDLDKTRGTDLTDAAAADHWADTFLNGFSAQQTYVAFAVWPDSQEAFTRLRDRLVARGFDYQLLIEDRTDQIEFGGGGDRHVQ